MAIEQQETATTEVSIVHQLNLGEHTLFIMSDQSIHLADPLGEPRSYLADNGVRLSREETYRLYISLHEMHKTPVQ